MATGQRTIVVTGASAGAGCAIGRFFGRRGWRVGLVARDVERLERVRDGIERDGGSARVLPADVADPSALWLARDRMVAEWGDIDVWVNCAMATVVSTVRQMRPDEYRRVTDVTYLGYVYGTLAALEHMAPRNRGTIVQVGSALAYRAIPLQSAYCGAKFAIRGFTDALRAELIHERSRVRVTMVQMPAMNTPQFDWARNKCGRKYQPVGTVYQPEAAATAVWHAVHRRPREVWVGWSTIKAIVGQRVAPALLDRLAARNGWDSQLTDIPEVPGRPDNLMQTVAGDHGAHGRFDARARREPFVLDPQHVWLPIAGAAALLVLARVARSRHTPQRR
jgi:short-subunit dehydrogenase